MNASVRRLVLVVGLAMAGCASPSTPTQPTPAPPPVRFPDLAAMAGTYTLTIDLDESCSAMPAAARHRVYQAILEDRGWHFIVVSIAGGGFVEPRQVGDLFSGDLNPAMHYDPRLKWNNFDLSCDVREPLAGGGELAVCGEGPIARSSALLSGAVKGYAYVSREGAVVARCEGVHRFWFER